MKKPNKLSVYLVLICSPLKHFKNKKNKATFQYKTSSMGPSQLLWTFVSNQMRDHQRLHQPLDGQHEAENPGADAAIRLRHVGPQTGSQRPPRRPLMPTQGNQSRQGPQPSRRQRRFSTEVITWRLTCGVGPSHTLYCHILIIFIQTQKEKQPFHRQKPTAINSRGQQRAAGQGPGARHPELIKLN